MYSKHLETQKQKIMDTQIKVLENANTLLEKEINRIKNAVSIAASRKAVCFEILRKNISDNNKQLSKLYDERFCLLPHS